MPKHFRISDFGCAAALVADGYEFVGIEPETAHRNYFIIGNKNEKKYDAPLARLAADEYFAGRMMVNALKMSDAVRHLKTALHADR